MESLNAETNLTASADEGQELSDRDLYQKCCFYGTNARLWTRKFAALLPEVERRKLYARHGFYSIFEFAARLAGMNRETVVDILRISNHLADKPSLKKLMSTEGWGKLRVVATIATKENEKMLAEKVKEMSKPTLATFVHEMKKQNDILVKNGTGPAFGKMNFESGEEFSEQRISVRMPLRPQTELRLRELQRKLSKERKGPVDFNEVMETLLDAYEKPVHELFMKPTRLGRPSGNSGDEKEGSGGFEEAETGQKNLVTSAMRGLVATTVKNVLRAIPSRHIPVSIKRVLGERHGGRCAYPRCMKLPEIFHHTRRFVLNQSHDPDFLMPLCKDHERLAHLGLIENEEKVSAQWHMKTGPDRTSPKYAIDRKVNRYRIQRPP